MWYTSAASVSIFQSERHIQTPTAHALLKDQLGARHGLDLIQPPHPDVHDPQHGVFMLALDGAHAAVPPLLLLLDLHRLALDAHDARAALEQPLVQVVGLAGALGVVALGVVQAGLECEVPRAEDGGAVQAQDVPWCDAVHVEWQADDVAFGDEVGEAVHVGGDVMWSLGMEGGEERLHRF